MYKRTPCGEHLVSVCTNTLCAVLGGDEIYGALQEKLGRRARADRRRPRHDGVDHPRARRVPGRLRLRAGAPGQLRVLRQPDRRSPREALVDALRRGEQPHAHARCAAHRLPHRRAADRGLLRRRPRRRASNGASAADETLAAARGWPPSAAGPRPATARRRDPRPAGRGLARRPPRRRPTPSRMTGRPASPRCSPGAARAAALDDRRPTSASTATPALRKALAAEPDAAHPAGQGLQPARPRRRRLPDRHEVALHPAGPTGPGAKPQYLVINADEGEPGTCRDLPLMMNDPHSLIEGFIIACYAIRAALCVDLHPRRGRARDPPASPPPCARRTPRATSARTSSARASTSTSSCTRGAGAYICGEETALLDSLEGRRGQPRLKPPFPATAGLYDAPDRGQQRRDARQRAVHRAGRRRLVQGDGPREVARPEDLLAVRARRAARASTRRRWAPRCASCSSWPAA